MVKRTTNSLIKQITQSEISLFVALIFALGNLLTFLDNNDLGGIILFFIVAFLIMMKSKNMVIVLGGAIIITNITVIVLKSAGLSLNTPIGIEGFKEGKDSKSKGNNDTKKNIPSPEPVTSANKDDEEDDEENKEKKTSNPSKKTKENLSKNMKQLRQKLQSSKNAPPKENMKVAQEALTKLEPLMDRAEGLMKMFNNMGGGQMMDSFLGGGLYDEEEE